MADYPISKEAVQKMLVDLRSSLGERYISIGISMALHKLEGFPQMDAVQVVHGRWIANNICSACWEGIKGWAIQSGYKFCPFCGAKMDGGTE